MRRKKVLEETTTTAKAAKLAKTASKSKKTWDGLTRVENPIKGVDTHGRQWRRWNP